jgi:hypothetical protein
VIELLNQAKKLASQRAASAFCLVLNIHDATQSMHHFTEGLQGRIISRGDTGGGLVATQWVLHGTHTGPLMDGTLPTGRTVAYPGASFTQVEGDKIRSEEGVIKFVCGSQPEIRDGSDQEEGARRVRPGRQEGEDRSGNH